MAQNPWYRPQVDPRLRRQRMAGARGARGLSPSAAGKRRREWGVLGSRARLAATAHGLRRAPGRRERPRSCRPRALPEPGGPGSRPSLRRRAVLAETPADARLVLRRCKLFGNDPAGITETGGAAGAGGPAVEVWRWPVRSSSLERAILEALDELPGNASFEHLDKIFEGLVSLRPKPLMTLLASCRSVKVRRLFFVFADRHGHSWRKYLDAERVEFGSGPRALVEGGAFHPTYRISVPDYLVPRRSCRSHRGSPHLAPGRRPRLGDGIRAPFR